MDPILHVVDDEEPVRRSLAMLLLAAGHQVETYDGGLTLLAAAGPGGEGLSPGCLILDVRMPGMDGLALLEELARRGVSMPAVVMTGHADVPLAVRAMRAGAVDFLEKPYTEERLLESIATALAEGEEGTKRRAAEARAVSQIATLSPREREVLECLVKGMANKVVAHQLGISPRTVEVHRANLMDKLKARSLPELVRIGLAAGM